MNSVNFRRPYLCAIVSFIAVHFLSVQVLAGQWGSDGYRGTPADALIGAIAPLDCVRVVRRTGDPSPAEHLRERVFQEPLILGAFQNPDAPRASLYLPSVVPGFKCANAADARFVLDTHPGNFVLFVAALRSEGRIQAVLAQIPSLHQADCTDQPSLAKEPRCSLPGASGACLDINRPNACRRIGYFTSWQTFTSKQDLRTILSVARTTKTPVYFVPGAIDLHHGNLGERTYAIDFIFRSDTGIIFMSLFLTSLNPLSDSFWSRRAQPGTPSSWAPPGEYFWIKRVDGQGPVEISQGDEEADRILGLRIDSYLGL